MKVGELFLALGLAVDNKSWSVGQAAIDKMTAELKALAVTAVTATGDAKKAMATIGLVGDPKDRIRHARRALAEMVKSGDRVTNTFRRMMVAATGFFAITKIKSMVKETVDLGGKLNDTAQKTGISTDALQEFGYAAGLNSSNLDELANGVTKLSKGLGSVKEGKGPAVDGLKALGISMSDPAVKGKNLEQILYLVASRFSGMPDGAKKTKAAMDLFGKSGANLIPTLNLGAQGLAQLRQEARDMGVVMDGKAVSGLDELGDNLDKAKVSLTALKNQAVVALIPVLQELVTGFSSWVRENKELIRSSITTVVSGLAAALRILGKTVVFVIDHWKLFAALIGGAVVLNAMMSLIRLIVFFQAVQTKAAIQAVINWIMILGPIFLIAAAILALGLLIYKFRDKIKAALGKVASFFSALWKRLKDTAAKIKQTFVDVGEGIKKAFRDAFEWVKTKAEELGTTLRNLPVIKQLGDFGVWAGRKMRGDNADGSSSSGYENAKRQGSLEKVGDRDETEAEFNARVQRNLEQQGAGAGRAPARAPLRSGGGQGGMNNQTSYQINIDAKNADAKEVASLVDQKLREHDERTRRQTAASLGLA